MQVSWSYMGLSFVDDELDAEWAPITPLELIHHAANLYAARTDVDGTRTLGLWSSPAALPENREIGRPVKGPL